MLKLLTPSYHCDSCFSLTYIFLGWTHPLALMLRLSLWVTDSGYPDQTGEVRLSPLGSGTLTVSQKSKEGSGRSREGRLFQVEGPAWPDTKRCMFAMFGDWRQFSVVGAESQGVGRKCQIEGTLEITEVSIFGWRWWAIIDGLRARTNSVLFVEIHSFCSFWREVR